jgi:hypothetical protein
MKEDLKNYLYSGVSFSTYKFDELSLLCAKYKLSFFKFAPYKKIKSILYKDYKDITKIELKYFIGKNINALYNSSVLIPSNEKEESVYSKIIYPRNSLEVSPLKSSDLPLEITSKKACFIIDKDKKNQIEYYKNLFKSSKIEYFDSYRKGRINEPIDKIGLFLLQDDSDIYFVSAGYFTNIVVEQIFNLNKIAIVL